MKIQLISIVLTTLLVPQILGCRWTFEDSCYDYVTDGANFWVSQAYCQENFNGNLVTINSQEENEFVKSCIVEHWGAQPGNFSFHFITNGIPLMEKICFIFRSVVDWWIKDC